jgi:murein DD-endopeptidase MepM/ murein hydrolase activator NlpD
MYENGNTGYLNVLMESNGFSDFLARVEYVNKLMDYDNNLLAEYQKNEETIATTVEEIKVDKANLETLQAEQESKTKELNAKVAEKEALVKKLNSDASTYEQQIKDLEAEDAEVQKLIQKANAEAAAKAKTSSSSSSSSSKSSSSSSSSSSGKVYASTGRKFMYPVPAYSGYKPNDIYGGRYSPISGKYETHSGLDLKATLNTDIVAAASGTVIYSGVRGGYGNCVIIDHGGGYSTLYGHNNSLVVSVGQTVQQGQVIAKAGTTGYSTGVHCHFEVRINGQTTNPYPYLFG